MTDLEQPQGQSLKQEQASNETSELISYEVAAADVHQWLKEVIGMTAPEFDTNKSTIDRVIAYVQEGAVAFEEQHIVHKLRKPLHKDDGSVHLERLKYHNRVRAHVIRAKTQNVSVTDLDGRFLAIASALTEVGAGVLGKLHQSDYRIVKDIAGFFM